MGVRRRVDTLLWSERLLAGQHHRHTGAWTSRRQNWQTARVTDLERNRGCGKCCHCVESNYSRLLCGGPTHRRDRLGLQLQHDVFTRYIFTRLITKNTTNCTSFGPTSAVISQSRD